MGSFLNWYLDTTQNLCLARDCVLAVRGSGTISASCSLLPFPVLADDRDGDADDEESRRRRRRRRDRFFLPPQLLIWMSNVVDENSQMDFCCSYRQ